MATPYDNKTIEEIRTLIINELQQQWNNKLRILPKSFIKILATVLAAIYIVLFKQIGWLFLQLFPETAYWKEITILGIRVRPLVKWGILIGVGEPKSGSQWRGNMRVDVTLINSPLSSGTQLKSDITGKIYLVDETKTLENEIETVAVVCAELGTAGNIEPGEKLYFVNPLGNVKKETEIINVINDAIDDETEAEYRYRVVNRWRMQPQGGSLADYRIWGSEVSGVLNIYPYNDSHSPSGVLLYVSGNPAIFSDRIPSAALLILVGNACTYNPETGKATRKPMTATIDPRGDHTYSNIKPVTIKIFDVHIYGVLGISALDFANAVRAPIEEYFLGRESYIRGLSDDNNKTNIVSKNDVSSVANQIAVSVKAEFDNVVLYKDGIITPRYNLSMDDNEKIRMGELAKMGNLYINGVLF
ncbi:hypothetical protein FACS189447_07850 [Spirochaetia bacterium]|nr:hypothetical protein FACS189447_07850 [Spirochaetia bacterium]